MAVIIYPPTIDWEYMRQRPQNLMLQFAKNGHKVFYCNKKQLKYPFIEEITENLFVINNIDWFLAECIPRIKKSYVPLIVWCSWSLIAQTLKSFQPDAIIYDCIDEFVDWLPYEADMVSMANIIFCSSDYLMERMIKQYPNKKIFLLQNGCEFQHFNFWENKCYKKQPADFPCSYRATIGYIGAWAWWVDVELVCKICNRYPEHQVVVIGPDLGAHLPIEFPNFKYLGLKEYKQLPNYLTYFDLCVIPFKINQTTMATNPIKVYEFLAAGKTVVATALPELLKMQPLVKIGNTHKEFLTLIGRSLNNRYEHLHEKIQFAQVNSWENRYAIIEKVLNDEIADFPDNLDFYDIDQLERLTNKNSFQCIVPVADVTISTYSVEDNMDFDPILIGESEGYLYRYMLKFDVKETAKKIKRAVLSVFIDKCENPENMRCIEVRKILADWVEDQVTWKTKPSFSPFPADKTYLSKSINWLEWDVTDLVKEWINKPESNFGVLLKESREEKPTLIRGVNRHRYDAYSPKIKVYFK